jgi:acylpyruvate hydrolase
MTYIILQGSKNTKEKIHVSKILCLGLNYSKHISEMKSEKPGEPMIFMKPSSAIIHNGGEIVLPGFSKEIHHEVETVVVIGKNAKNIPQEEALDYIGGFGIGLDMTLRDIQGEAKKAGKPWTVAKGFDTSAPVSEFVAKKYIKDINDIDFSLIVNDQLRQKGNTSDMIFKFAEIIAYLSSVFTLYRGDLIFTGTPDGVGPVNSGDKLIATLSDLVSLKVSVRNN